MSSVNSAGRWFLVWSLCCMQLMFAGRLAHAQSSTNPPLQGGVQQSAPAAGDQFQGQSSSPTSDQAMAASSACQQPDAECGGTSRLCYDQTYQSKGIVMSVQKSQTLYAKTGGQIWYRCGSCKSEVICWPRPGFQNLISGTPDDGAAAAASQGGSSRAGPNGGGAGPAHPMDDTMKNVVASCAMAKKQGTGRNCDSPSVDDYCNRTHDPNCIGIIADNPPRYGVPGARVTSGGQVVIPGGAEAQQQISGTPGAAAEQARALPPGQVMVGGTLAKYDLKRPYYNGQSSGYFTADQPGNGYQGEIKGGYKSPNSSVTIDVSREAIIKTQRKIPGNQGATVDATVTPYVDGNGMLLYMMLTTSTGLRLQLLPSKERLVPVVDPKKPPEPFKPY